GVIVVENHEAQGVSGARNAGLEVARAPIIAFIDDDGIADPDWLERVRSGFDDAAVIGVGGSVDPLWERRRPAWFPREFDWVIGCTYESMPKKPEPVRNLITCNMAVRRDVFDIVGGFELALGRLGTTPLGCDETEFCI